MNKKEFIAYDGQKFSIEWYFGSNGKSQALDYYENLSVRERVKVLRLFKYIGDIGEIRDKTKFIFEGDKIYAFKPQPDRFLAFFWKDKKIIVTNAFRKKQRKLPGNEKISALKRMQDYDERMKIGVYYEETNTVYV